MAKRVIKHKFFTYHREEQGIKPDNTIGDIVVEYTAHRGEEVDLSEADLLRGDKHDAFYTAAEVKAIRAAEAGEPGAVAPEVQPANAVDLSQMSEEETVAWLQGKGPGAKPSVPQVLTAVRAVEDEDEQDETAERVLAAEKGRGDSDPRKSLVDGLTEIIDAEDDEDEDEDE